VRGGSRHSETVVVCFIYQVEILRELSPKRFLIMPCDDQHGVRINVSVASHTAQRGRGGGVTDFVKGVGDALKLANFAAQFRFLSTVKF
jgi:hypothetical protein